MKRYCLGARNDVSHNYSIVFQTNSIILANLVAIIIKPLVKEVDITLTSDIIIINNESPFDDKYYYK